MIFTQMIKLHYIIFSTHVKSKTNIMLVTIQHSKYGKPKTVEVKQSSSYKVLE